MKDQNHSYQQLFFVIAAYVFGEIPNIGAHKRKNNLLGILNIKQFLAGIIFC